MSYQVGYWGTINGGVLTTPGAYYDVNQTYLGEITGVATQISTITIPANTYYVRINLRLAMSIEWFFKAFDTEKFSLDWLENNTGNYVDKSITTAKLGQDVIDLINEPIFIPENPTQWTVR